MNLKKVTIRFVFTIVTAVALGSMIASCSNEEFEGPRLTLATRSAGGTEPSNMEFGNKEAYIPDELIGSSGCVYKAIKECFGEEYTLDSIKKAMSHFSRNVEYYPIDSIVPAINRLTGKNVTSYTPSLTSQTIARGDMVCISCDRVKNVTKTDVTSGHAAIIKKFYLRDGYYVAECHDGSFFNLAVVSLIIRTSLLK